MKRPSLISVFWNILRTALLLALCFLLPSTVAAQGNIQDNVGTKGLAALFEQANITQTQGNYQQAVDQYLAIIRNNGVSVSLLYNLAGSYAAEGRTGLAVLNYERALRLAPGDSDIQANLEQVRKDAGLYRDDSPFYVRLTNLLGADQWLMVFGLAFLLLAVSALTASMTKKILVGKGDILRLLMLGSVVVMLVTLPPTLLCYQSWNDGVVTEENARLLISPFAEAVSAGGIKAGRVIRPGNTHGEYVLIEDEIGQNGWLVRDSFQLVVELPGG